MHFRNEFGWISRIWLWKYFCFETWVAYEQLQVGRTVLKAECVRLILPKFFAYLEYSWPPHIYNRIWSRSNNEMLLVLKEMQCLDGQERMEESEGSLKPVSTAQHMSIKGLGASCPISWQNAQRCPRTCQIKQSVHEHDSAAISNRMHLQGINRGLPFNPDIFLNEWKNEMERGPSMVLFTNTTEKYLSLYLISKDDKTNISWAFMSCVNFTERRLSLVRIMYPYFWKKACDTQFVLTEYNVLPIGNINAAWRRNCCQIE